MNRFSWVTGLGLWLLAAALVCAEPSADAVRLGFEDGVVGKVPEGWFVPTPGWKAELTDAQSPDGKNCARLAPEGDTHGPVGNLMRTIDAAAYRGHHVVLAAKVRVEGSGGRAQMWLRADRPDNRVGPFDNMGDRAIRPGGWSDAVIEADIDADARHLAIGFMALQGATVWIDSVSLRDAGKALRQEPSAARPLTARGLENLQAAARLISYVRFFHPSDQAVAVASWDHFAVHVMEEAEPAAEAADLARRLQGVFAPIAPSLRVWAGEPSGAPPMPPKPEGATGVAYWRHNGAGSIGEARAGTPYASKVVHEAIGAPLADESDAAAFVVKPLGGGVCCRLPIRIYTDAQGTLPQAEMPAAWVSAEHLPRLTALNRSTRLAGVALCWGVMQHFYPYFDVVETDWDAALPAALSKAAQDTDELAYLYTLRELIAKLHDGHGNVSNPAVQAADVLPLAFAWAGNDLVVVGTGAGVPNDLKIGDTVVAIDGRPLAACCEELSTRISAATEGWRRTVLLRMLPLMATADPCRVQLRHPDGAAFEVRIARAAPAPIDDATAKKPADGAEVAPGIVYFNLSGASVRALDEAMPALEAAKGIIFDLRGYPSDGAFQLMRHLTDTPATSARWNIPVVTRPDREGWTWSTGGRWNIPAAEPRLRAPCAFLTDGRAISYAESIMGIVEAYRMGEIVGATTAGTNGNVNPFKLPGGYTVTWTGMQVLKHDKSRHHGVGIKPTVPVAPTARGIAEGRDEVLEKAVEVLKGKIGAGG